MGEKEAFQNTWKDCEGYWLFIITTTIFFYLLIEHAKRIAKLHQGADNKTILPISRGKIEEKN